MTTTNNDIQLGLVKLGTMFPSTPNDQLDLISSNAGDDRRVHLLRQLLLSQLDLIQKQSETISAKDQKLKELQHENDGLRQRVADLESASKAATKLAKSKIKVEPLEEGDDEEVEGMETDLPYFSIQHEAVNQPEEVEEKPEEIPGFRLRPIAPSYIMEGTENIEDETILKRHHKPENDEKRRKRWDVQRIREQRHVARLRARYDPNDEQLPTVAPKMVLPKIAKLTELKEEFLITSLLPDPDEATDIVVQDRIPVSAFGCVLPNLRPKDFFLPWV